MRPSCRPFAAARVPGSSHVPFQRDAPPSQESPAQTLPPYHTRPESRINHIGRRLLKPQVSPQEIEKQRIRRVKKAERDERMDIAAALTPPKTYMGGFTRPKDLRISNWWPGGAYLLRQKKYESPEPKAYSPQTLYLLESRHPIKFGIGRATTLDHIVDKVTANALPDLLRKMHAPDLHHSSSLWELYDKAEWPWLAREPKSVNWTEKEDYASLWKRLHSGQMTLKEFAWIEEQVQKARAQAIEKQNPMQESQIVDPTVPLIHPDAPTWIHNESKSPSSTSPVSTCRTPSSAPSIPLEHKSTFPAPSSTPSEIASSTSSDPPQTNTSHAGSRLENEDEDRPSTGPRTFKKVPTPADFAAHRERYRKTFTTEPFWRPLLTVTYSTRPVRDTVLRLSRAHERGLPFYASIPDQDRKYGLSFGARMREMRISRIRSLTVEVLRRYEGYQGGFIGVRFSPEDRGRGLDEEILERGMPRENKLVTVGIGKWAEGAEEQFELWQKETEEFKDFVVVRWMDDWGYLLDADGNRLPGQDVPTTKYVGEEKDEEDDNDPDEEDAEEDEEDEKD